MKRSIITSQAAGLINRRCLCDNYHCNLRGGGHIHYWCQLGVVAASGHKGAGVLHCVSAEGCVCRGLNLPLGPDPANWGPFNFDKYSLFNLGPAVIQKHQEATLAIFMKPNISLILKSCCSFVWQRGRNEVITPNWTRNIQTRKFFLALIGGSLNENTVGVAAR